MPPMEALAAAAATATPTIMPSDSAAGGGGHPGPWTFPVFVGCRRRLAPDDELFEAGNLEREALAREAAVATARDERKQLSKEAGLAADAELAHQLYECSQCHATLPTSRLLELHVSEAHDSFFAAQAARRLPVFLCLVEGCARKFCTVEERKQHLTDHHKFPRHFHFDRLHLKRRKAQIRPLPQFQKGHGRQAMAADEAADSAAGAATAAQPAAAGDDQQQQGAAGAGGQGAGVDAAAGPASPTVAAADAVAHGMSRLSMAAETSSVPSAISFGRGRGRGLMGVGRGRGGQKASGGTQG